MSEGRSKLRAHFVLNHTAKTEVFRSPHRGGNGGMVSCRNRRQHGQALLQQLNNLKPDIEQAKIEQQSAGMEQGFGLQIEFESFPDIELAFESLASERSGIELLNVRHEGEATLATVFVPEGKLPILEGKITAYLDESKDKVNEKKGTKTPFNQKLLDTIKNIRVASLKALWTDDLDVFPVAEEDFLWWEVWLPVRGDRAAVVEQFRLLAEGLGFRIAEGEVEFPERTVLLLYGSLSQMRRSARTLNSIAELRRAKETADFFDSLPSEEQSEWVSELFQRMTVPNERGDTPYICLLDTGVNAGHPLLTQSMRSQDSHTVEPGWGTNDQQGHGTEMAGLALLGNLTSLLDGSDPIAIEHRLESVKLLDQRQSNVNNPENHAYLTAEAVSRSEITAPQRQRLFSMAVTADDARDRGRPSVWSATIDRLAVDYENQAETQRLFIISAGNVDDPNAWTEYPDSNTTESIHDPGQAWNALTIGASTGLIHITEPDTKGYQPIAPEGGLSPFSTTSQLWESHWPLKPDVVFEGGNAAKDAIGAVWMPSLSLLTTSAQIADRLLTTTNATSAATALAARMAARLMAAYPQLRLETIRALMVHSADWTPAMRQQFLADPKKPSKGDVANLIRHCGFGQPDLERALWSVENSLTLICEESLQPFMREGKKPPKLREMNLHHLPWPLPELEALGEVEMRVTLSYFIEPNPSARGVKSRYRYESHGLRFDVKRPYESDHEFHCRINLAARDVEEGGATSSGNDPNWMLGPSNRHRGSLHSDIWRGSAADLASRGVLSVFPVSGWWKMRPKLGRYDQKADYSLLISIRAPKVEVELYSAIENHLKIMVEV